MTDMIVFDRDAVRAHRDRAATRIGTLQPVLDDLAARVLDRLDDTQRHFARALDLGGRGAVAPMLAARGMTVISADLSAAMAARAGGIPVAADEEALPFASGAFDLIVAHLGLHWANDLPGALIQLRRALAPDGLFIASLPLIGTLGDLRAALIEAEASATGGATPRVSPFPDLADCAGLMQRAGFALPIAELDEITFDYADPFGLLRDLRDAGETNAVADRSRRVAPRALFPEALSTLANQAAASGSERMAVSLRLAVLTGWGPPAPGS